MPPQLPVAGFHERCPVVAESCAYVRGVEKIAQHDSGSGVALMSNYAKGANAERLWIKMLLAGNVPGPSGLAMWPPALWAARTAGSHSKVDVMASFSDCDRLFQLKRGGAKVDESEVAYLRVLARPWRECFAVEWPDYATPILSRIR